MDDFYLYLYCGDSLATQVNNHAGDFVVVLPRTYRLNGRWECALVELTLKPQTEQRSDRLYVCTDLIDESYLRDTFLPILRTILPTDEDVIDIEFGTPHYMSIHRNELDRVRIFIRGDRLQPCRFKIDHLYCTLHFRKREWDR